MELTVDSRVYCRANDWKSLANSKLSAVTFQLLVFWLTVPSLQFSEVVNRETWDPLMGQAVKYRIWKGQHQTLLADMTQDWLGIGWACDTVALSYWLKRKMTNGSVANKMENSSVWILLVDWKPSLVKTMPISSRECHGIYTCRLCLGLWYFSCSPPFLLPFSKKVFGILRILTSLSLWSQGSPCHAIKYRALGQLFQN